MEDNNRLIVGVKSKDNLQFSLENEEIHLSFIELNLDLISMVNFNQLIRQ